MKGENGEAGAPATRIWASIDSSRQLSRGSGVEKVVATNTGITEIFFNQNVNKCAYSGTIGESTEGGALPAFITVQPVSSSPTGLFVKTYDAAGASANEPFYVEVFC